MFEQSPKSIEQQVVQFKLPDEKLLLTDNKDSLKGLTGRVTANQYKAVLCAHMYPMINHVCPDNNGQCTRFPLLF